MMHRALHTAFAVVICALAAATIRPVAAQSDLDAFMRDVVAKRDDNWKKLQQYILDEREVIELRGPSHVPIWGERREYSWYLRDGFFIRSPVKFNGVAIAEADRLQYERDYLQRLQKREKRGRGENPENPKNPENPENPKNPENLENLILQTRQPEFVSSAYFLRFKFDEGKYALVGREQLDGREVVRVEYYPTKLFGGTDRRRAEKGASDKDKAYDAEFQRLMNKVSLVTLWIEPKAHQIVKYTFDNVSLDFLPVQWLVHVDDLHATMNMGQPFPDVWLPRDLNLSLALTLAIGQFDVHYGLDYANYKRADVATKVTIK
ncbi:MAG TPA: hypothetical protein VGJ29_03010 [Vicinamibacterales bacterium]|jgi:hypothetical protein